MCASQDCSEDRGHGMGALLSSELAIGAQGGTVATLLPRILSQVCRGTGWLPTLGVGCRGEQHGQHKQSEGPSRHSFSAACQSCKGAPEAQPEGRVRRSSGVCPPFPEAGEDPTLLAPPTLLPQATCPPSFPSQGTRATPAAGQGPGV